MAAGLSSERRYRQKMWLPEGVREWPRACEAYDRVQPGMGGYDHHVYLEATVIQSQPPGRAQRSDERLRGVHRGAGGPADPAAVDRVGWKVIDEKRVAEGWQPVALAKSSRGEYLNMQPEHMEFAGALGLGVFEDARTELRKFELG